MPVTLRDFTKWLDSAIPLEYQESYDNSGLQVGDPEAIITSVLLTIDVTSEVIAEAEKKKCNLVLSHHPLIFSPLRRIAGGNATEKAVSEAIHRNIAVYSTHTCFDNMAWGVSHILAEKAGLTDIKVLMPVAGKLFKIAVFVPVLSCECCAGGTLCGRSRSNRQLLFLQFYFCRRRHLYGRRRS